MHDRAESVDQYIADLPAQRRETVQAVRAVILENLPKGYEEGMQNGMIGYFVPHSVYPAGYHCDSSQPVPFASLASQKNHLALYLMCVYTDPELQAWFRQAWQATGKKLDMGSSCVRFKKVEDVPLDVIGETIRRVPVKKFIEQYEAALGSRAKRPKSTTRQKVAPTRTKKSTSARAGAKQVKSTGKTTARSKSNKRASQASTQRSKRSTRSDRSGKD